MTPPRRWAYLVQHYCDLSFETHPAACAVRCHRQGVLTYEELYRRSNRLAHCLRAAGVRRQSRVGLCLERGAQSVVAMLGVLKADAVYVPIHELSPLGRYRPILDDCRPDAIIADRKTVDRVLAAGHGGSPALILFEPEGTIPAPPKGRFISQAEVDAQPDDPPGYANVDTDIAHILYTSGSTGIPKGVMISHANVVHYIEWAVEYFGISRSDRILGTAPFHFDMSTFDLYSAQKAGATLCIATEEDTLFPARLLQFAEEEGATLWKGVASLLAYVARAGAIEPSRLPALTRVLFSGERLPTRALMAWMSTFPEKRFYNVYGPTEATGISTAHAIENVPGSADATIPIGRACANAEVLVLDAAGKIAGTGETGEICIRGSGLSRGYWNDEQKTRLAFVDNPASEIPGDRLYRTGDLGFRDPEGVLHLVGRRDEQVKWMGYRIELGEITVSLQALPEVVDGAVLLLPGRADDTEELVGFVVLARGTTAAAVLTALRQKLPAYMVPRRILEIPAMPRSDRGKMDREALERIHSTAG